MLHLIVPLSPWDRQEPAELADLRERTPRGVFAWAVALSGWCGVCMFSQCAERVEQVVGLSGVLNAAGVRVMLLGVGDANRVALALERRRMALIVSGALLDAPDCAWSAWPELPRLERLDPAVWPTPAEIEAARERDPWRGGVEAAPGRRLRLRGGGGALPAESEPSDAPLRMAGAALRPSATEPAAVTVKRSSGHGNLVALRQRDGRTVAYTFFGADAEIVGHVVGRAPCGDSVVLTYTEFEALPRLLRRAGVRGVGVSTVNGCRTAAGG